MGAEIETPKVPIRAKLLAATGALLVTAMAVYGFVAFASARDALLPSIREQLADDAVNVKGGVEEMLAANLRNVSSWARLPIMRELVVRDLDKTVAHFLEAVHRDYGVYLDVLVLDREGVCVASSRPADIGVDFRASARSAAASAAAPSVEWSQQHRAWYVRLSAPVLHPEEEGIVLGTLVAMLDREVLDRIVVSKPGHSQVELRLLDDRGRVVAGRREGTEHDAPLAPWTAAATLRPEAGAAPLLHEAVDAAGRRLIVAETAVGGGTALPALDWRLAASLPRDVALAPVDTVRDRVLATGSALILLGLLAAALLARRLSRPVLELTAVATRIAHSGTLEPIPAPSSRDEIGQLADAFEHMVAAVSRANDELLRSSRLALLGEMAAGMAHEIRTPLGIIRGSAQLLERRMSAAGDAQAEEWAVFIREEVDRLARVVTDLLDYARPSPPRLARVDLDALLRRAVHMLGHEAESRGVALAVAADSRPVEAVCDGDQVQQVFLNLLMNALQACSPGGRVAAFVREDGDRATIVVRDDGRGIPPEVADRLFEPFTTRREGGIGLGLAIVSRIIRAHGGRVAARDREGGPGAEFEVSLPKDGAPAPGGTRDALRTADGDSDR